MTYVSFMINFFLHEPGLLNSYDSSKFCFTPLLWLIFFFVQVGFFWLIHLEHIWLCVSVMIIFFFSSMEMSILTFTCLQGILEWTSQRVCRKYPMRPLGWLFSLWNLEGYCMCMINIIDFSVLPPASSMINIMLIAAPFCYGHSLVYVEHL